MDKNLSLQKNAGFGKLITAINAVSNKITFPSFSGSYSIRKIKQKDNSDVKDFIRKRLILRGGVGLDNLLYDQELLDIHSSYSQNGQAFWVMMTGGKVIGTIGLKVNLETKEGILTKLYIENDKREHALSLIQVALSSAKKMGCKACNITLSQKEADIKEVLEEASFSATNKGLIPAMTFCF